VWRPADVDMVFLRENTEDLYVGAGTILRPGGVAHVATDTRIITRRASERVIRLAFQMASRRSGAPKDGQKRVTAVVKNNVLDGCRMFVEVFEEVAREFPDTEPDVAIVDAFTQWLITEPERYDVVVTTNMFGDIVTDLASVLQGGMGMAVGCNVGDTHAMFEPIHGSAPPFAGQDKLNPMAMLGAVAEGLRWLGLRRRSNELQTAADRIESAIRALLASGAPLTFDLVGEDEAASMSKVADAIIDRI
ncbi:MAG: isocitrate/isopropylmalate family dehydrogenase, partial [Myxococcota bacterium]